MYRNNIVPTHTPGPWIAPSAGVWTEDGIMIADCGSVDVISSLQKAGRDPIFDVMANTRLIAAAPTMLRTLELLEIQLSYQHAPDQDMQIVMRNSTKDAISTAKEGVTFSFPNEASNGKSIGTWDYHQNGQHTLFTKEDWRHEVANDDTILGYQEWVEHQLASDTGGYNDASRHIAGT